MKAAILLAEGFEEAEAIIIIDFFRRLQIPLDTLACHSQREVTSYHDIMMQADKRLEEVENDLYEAVIIPGGPSGTVNLAANPQAIAFLQLHDRAGRLLCPICSAAARVLGAHKLLRGRRYVCSGDLYQQVDDGVYVDSAVVEDGNLISGKGLGVAFDFAAAVASRLMGEQETALSQLEHFYYQPASQK